MEAPMEQLENSQVLIASLIIMFICDCEFVQYIIAHTILPQFVPLIHLLAFNVQNISQSVCCCTIASSSLWQSSVGMIQMADALLSMKNLQENKTLNLLNNL